MDDTRAEPPLVQGGGGEVEFVWNGNANGTGWPGNGMEGMDWNGMDLEWTPGNDL